jgi:hypothetical protein
MAEPAKAIALLEELAYSNGNGRRATFPVCPIASDAGSAAAKKLVM